MERRAATAAGTESDGAPSGTSGGAGWETLPGLGDASEPGSELDFDPAELREFLAGDLLDVQADPVFKEKLRRKLWRIVRTRYGGLPDEDE